MLDDRFSFISHISLSSDDCLELVELLEKCSTMAREESRSLIVKYLRQHGQQIAIRTSGNTRVDIHYIVDACLDYTSGIEPLMRLLRHFEADSLPFQAVEQFLEQHRYPDTQKWGYLQKLMPILQSITLKSVVLETLHRKSIPSDPLETGTWRLPSEPTQTKTLITIVSQLADALTPEGQMPPLLDFLERLALLCSKSTRARLRGWVEENAREVWKVRADTLQTRRRELEQEQVQSQSTQYTQTNKTPSPPSLLITFNQGEKRSHLSEEFIVEAWLLYGLQLKEYVLLHSSVHRERYAYETIPRLLDELLEEVEANPTLAPEEKAELRIEFFVPCEYFYEAFDNWQIDAQTIRLGVQHQVVIRAAERLKDRRYHSLWITKWNRLQQLSQEEGQTSIFWIHDLAQCEGEQVHARLRPNAIVCLALLVAPPPMIGQAVPRHLFRMMLKAGTPIALWPRRNLPDSKRVQSLLRARLFCHPLTSLPNQVWKARQEAWSKDTPDHLGRYITLLWDDPTRLPPEEHDQAFEVTPIRG